MDNQHREIAGYRELSEDEIMLMNKVKALGTMIEAVLNEVSDTLVEQAIRAPKLDAATRAQSIHKTGTEGPDSPEQQRLWAAEPKRWFSMARTDFQVGLMKLVRAIAQPGSF